MRLLYVADPLCSWCYGFGPELARLLQAHPEAQVELIMGGLRAFNREPMSAPFKAMLREHWEHVRHASGLDFDESVLEREGFVYDTEPACRAVVTARELDRSRALDVMKAIQVAFYREARDVTDPGVLADIAAACGYERDAFLRELESDAMRSLTMGDFAATQSMGVGGFPTLGVAHGEQLYLVTSGFVKSAVLAERLAAIADKTGVRDGF